MSSEAGGGLFYPDSAEDEPDRDTIAELPPPAAVTGLVMHVVYCRGCKQAWEQPERIGLLDFAPAGDCACTCADDRNPLFEAWLVDPWVCYCGAVAPLDPYVFPHRDCDGGRPLTLEDLAGNGG